MCQRTTVNDHLSKELENFESNDQFVQFQQLIQADTMETQPQCVCEVHGGRMAKRMRNGEEKEEERKKTPSNEENFLI